MFLKEKEKYNTEKNCLEIKLCKEIESLTEKNKNLDTEKQKLKEKIKFISNEMEEYKNKKIYTEEKLKKNLDTE
jgi:FtsZ-binding cell division protein ZapB